MSCDSEASVISSDHDDKKDDNVTAFSKYIIFNKNKEDTNKYMCTICKKTLSGEAPVQAHLSSAKHIKHEIDNNKNVMVPDDEPVTNDSSKPSGEY